MYVRDARGALRPVLVDQSQTQGDGTTSWTRKTTTTKTMHSGGGGDPGGGRQGGLLLARKDVHANGRRDSSVGGREPPACLTPCLAMRGCGTGAGDP